MKKEIEIVKNIFLPFFKEESYIISEKVNWKDICSTFIAYENDSKLILNQINKLELSNPDKVISKLPTLYKSFINEIAEDYILGEKYNLINILISQKSILFSERVAFLKTLNNVIIKQERIRIKKELNENKAKFDFFLSDTDVNSVMKKKARLDLKNKFNNWDNELVEEKVTSIKKTGNSTEKSKVFSIHLVKYAVAACLIISAGLFYFNSDNKMDVLANVVTTKHTISIVEDNGLGYIAKEQSKKIEVIFKDYQMRIASINKVKKNTSAYKAELDSLKSLKNTYIFNGEKVIINSKDDNEKLNLIRLYGEVFYIQKNNLFYKIIESNSPIKMIDENDKRIIEELEKIIFQNE
jgi:hypothetical protein